MELALDGWVARRKVERAGSEASEFDGKRVRPKPGAAEAIFFARMPAAAQTAGHRPSRRLPKWRPRSCGERTAWHAAGRAGSRLHAASDSPRRARDLSAATAADGRRDRRTGRCVLRLARGPSNSEAATRRLGQRIRVPSAQSPLPSTRRKRSGERLPSSGAGRSCRRPGGAVQDGGYSGERYSKLTKCRCVRYLVEKPGARAHIRVGGQQAANLSTTSRAAKDPALAEPLQHGADVPVLEFDGRAARSIRVRRRRLRDNNRH